MNVWDIRLKDAKVESLPQDGKVFAADAVGNTFIVCTSARRVARYDMRKMSSAVEERDSPLKYQTRDVSLFPDEKGYCLTSTEGRVAVEFLSSGESAPSHTGFTFKCHRQPVEDKVLVFPVNVVAFHPM